MDTKDDTTAAADDATTVRGERMDDYVLAGTLPEYLDHQALSPLDRFRPLTEWLDARYDSGLDSYSKYTSSEIGPVVSGRFRKGDAFDGINFASQEYLNLSTHPDVRQAAKLAIDRYGVHSAGSAALMGNTLESVELERQIAKFTGFADCTLFPTGWSAGYGIIRTLVRPSDHVVIDVLAHACLYEGAHAATKNVRSFPHLSNAGVERRLKRIREGDATNAIVVVTESTFSMDSDVPDIRELQEICRRHRSTLVVDCAHDLGAIGKAGGGYLELQGMVGAVDVLMGSFSKAFASNGGFVATDNQALKLGIRYSCGPHTFSNAMSPVNAAIVKKCFEIVASSEGAELRRRLWSNVQLLRRLLTERDFEVLGKESAIVPVVLGDNGISRLITKYTFENGGVVNLVEYPAVSRGRCRWRLQVMSGHTELQIRQFVEIATKARERARRDLG